MLENGIKFAKNQLKFKKNKCCVTVGKKKPINGKII